MTKKKRMELLLSKVADDKKAAFVAELREAKSKDELPEIVKKYGVSLSEEEKEAFKAMSSKLSDEELDVAAGGCCETSYDS